MIISGIRRYSMTRKDILWSSMLFHEDVRRHLMIFDDLQWYLIEFDDIQWYAMKSIIIYDIQFYFMAFDYKIIIIINSWRLKTNRSVIHLFLLLKLVASWYLVIFGLPPIITHFSLIHLLSVNLGNCIRDDCFENSSRFQWNFRFLFVGNIENKSQGCAGASLDRMGFLEVKHGVWRFR